MTKQKKSSSQFLLPKKTCWQLYSLQRVPVSDLNGGKFAKVLEKILMGEYFLLSVVNNRRR